MFKNPFEGEEKKLSNRNKVTFAESDVIFVSDYFRDEYAGGAELTTDALFQSSPVKTFLLKSNEVTEDIISHGMQKLWVFFNFTQINYQLLPAIVANCHYHVVEYDYKFCRYRSIEKHKADTGEECDCHNSQHGMLTSAFLAGAEHVFWMSKNQHRIYQDRFPFLDDKNTSVLSSVFDVKDMEFIENLRKAREENPKSVKDKFIILNSSSWIKGVDDTQRYLEDNQIDFKLVSGLSYYDMLRELSEHKGIAFMPLGGDTCPRFVIEAKLLGLNTILNENVQHTQEAWWEGDIDTIETYLLDGHNRFWDKITGFYQRTLEISGYTTTKNVIENEYPWRASIISLLDFCDEVIVVDGGSTDGTWEELQTMAAMQGDGRLKVHQIKRDWDSKRFAVFDGAQKAEARKLCSKDWCWQQDIDEVVHEKDALKVKTLARQLPKAVHLIALPVIEYWGGPNKVRCDINPWKWRLSRNLDHITHGIPSKLRKQDASGELYADLGTDGCDYIDSIDYSPIHCTHFYTQEAHKARMLALQGNKDALDGYQGWLNSAVENLPGVHHYSWFDLERKINTYKNYWSRHWQSLYNVTQDDIPENNMFFEKTWSEVTKSDVKTLANKLKSEMGGWIFHQRVDFNQPTPHIEIERSHPKHVKEWISGHNN
jgi:glycosyltransferase involved in cell wall biosynthesis